MDLMLSLPLEGKTVAENLVALKEVRDILNSRGQDIISTNIAACVRASTVLMETTNPVLSGQVLRNSGYKVSELPVILVSLRSWDRFMQVLDCLADAKIDIEVCFFLTAIPKPGKKNKLAIMVPDDQQELVENLLEPFQREPAPA